MNKESLALFGGSPAVEPGLVVPWPAPNEADLAALGEVIKSGMFHRVNHPEVVALQKEFAAWQGSRFAIIVSSGGAALHVVMDYIAKPEGEVITSMLNWPGAVAPICNVGMRPVFVDIDIQSGNFDLAQIESLISARTVAILVTHLFGNPNDMDRIYSIANRHGISIVEDCAQSVGASYNQKKVGNFGLGAAFSGNGAKQLAAGELGIIATHDEQLAEHVDKVSLSSYERRHERTFAYQSQGFNYRPNAFSAAVARARLRSVDEQIEQRVENCEYLAEHLENLPGVIGVVSHARARSSPYLYSIRVVPEQLGLQCTSRQLRDGLSRLLSAEGVSASCWLRKPVVEFLPQAQTDNLQQQIEAEFPNTIAFQNSMIQIKEIAPPQNSRAMERYVNAVLKVWDCLPQLDSWLQEL